MIDKNGNGKISKQEFTDGYSIIFGASNKTPLEIENEVEMIWGKIDVDGSGEIDYTEWALGTANKDFLFTEPKLKQAFQLFDSDGSGKISIEELKVNMQPMLKGKMSD
jgi:calcium-dependent protein kinase